MTIHFEAEQTYRRLLDAWFPRCVAPAGGFHENYTSDWRPRPDKTRFLVFQSRMTWAAAIAAEALPERGAEFADYARHGLGALRSLLADPDEGGFFWRVDLSGSPVGLEPHLKRTYGLAFAVFALAAAARALDDPAVKETAWQSFDWLDRNFHDDHGGYFECAERDGTPLERSRPELAGPELGMAGGPGRKAQNTHLHMLEMLMELYRLSPERRVEIRIEEVVGLFIERMFAEPGHLNVRFRSDWTPVGDRWEIGHDLEAAYLILSAVRALGRDWPSATHSAKRLVDRALEFGFDSERGGFFEWGRASGKIEDRCKGWWTQFEGLNALVAGLEAFPSDRAMYAKALQSQWVWIRDFQQDAEFGGFFGRLSESGERLDDGAKGHEWKAAYHDSRALLNLWRASAAPR